jgi:HD superfamily phosphodiesterase
MLLSNVIKFVIASAAKYNIDESHGLSHSLQTLYYANRIFDEEVSRIPSIKTQERIVYVSAAIHDLCDKKYVDEGQGLMDIEEFLQDKLTSVEVDVTKQIISTMSYSKVKRDGFPSLGEYQPSYHIVRESDLLAAYDFDRAMIYFMNNHPGLSSSENILQDSFLDSKEFFNNRVLKQYDDNLFFSNFAKQESLRLYHETVTRMWHWNKIINKPELNK